MTQTYDVVGIGLGPFNLGMAALLEDVDEVDALFLERKPSFQWHPGLLLEGTTLQVPFLADLVTMANPKSRFSFLEYLHDIGRLYQFYFLESFHIPRREYNDYCQWVARQLKSCSFNRTVTDVYWDEVSNQYVIKAFYDDTITYYYARHVVFGMGTQPTMPEWTATSTNEVLHSAEYAYKKNDMLNASSITIVGSGQSAAEVFLDLLQEQSNYPYRLNWYTRSKGFFPMEYSKLGLEHFSPDYTSYFYQLPQSTKDDLLAQQDLLYKGISADTIADIYQVLYERSIGNAELDVQMLSKTSVKDIHLQNGHLTLECYQWEQERTFTADSDYVVAATGYENPYLGAFKGVEKDLQFDPFGRPVVNEYYDIALTSERSGKLYIQNGEMHTHGVGAPDLGLGAYRNATIINQIAGKVVYTIRSKNIFQDFGVDATPKPSVQV
ncbi:lysine N(6)-hydroxylase/L-ornithine N(5)-oxygenase family protein [Pontibacillus yanchengensis]|uniref:L-lysine N6-monooxygenase MbtG n=1 Tax=Pontibacillus yanchengensis Y32 TaxID=1385514 RepID=A0A0A2TDA7_9BACI|nr:lysine N(6)-hydroxylase/L-ornithine N(5)-oxygenase family protein [Pontibacillus yanchengensis]KGP72091.1 lysine 6-monooxygenase [Pontibacillus yanchengensis Y32]